MSSLSSAAYGSSAYRFSTSSVPFDLVAECYAHILSNTLGFLFRCIFVHFSFARVPDDYQFIHDSTSLLLSCGLIVVNGVGGVEPPCSAIPLRGRPVIRRGFASPFRYSTMYASSVASNSSMHVAMSFLFRIPLSFAVRLELRRAINSLPFL